MNNKKKALGSDPLSWIKPTVSINDETDSGHEPDTPQNRGLVERDRSKGEDISQIVPKFETYQVRLTVRFNEEHLEFLSGLERSIMRNRSARNRGERITKNSIIRSLVNLASQITLDANEIRNEKELEMRIREAAQRMTKTGEKKPRPVET